MMVIAVIGDSHVPSRAPAIPDWVLDRCRKADYVIHAGDFDSPGTLEIVREANPELTAVRGNADSDEGLPPVATLDVEGIRFVVTHGTGDRAGYEERVAGTVAANVADGLTVGVSGHTHQVMDREVDGYRLLNPGSCTGVAPASETTMMLVDVEAGAMEVRVLADGHVRDATPERRHVGGSSEPVPPSGHGDDAVAARPSDRERSSTPAEELRGSTATDQQSTTAKDDGYEDEGYEDDGLDAVPQWMVLVLAVPFVLLTGMVLLLAAVQLSDPASASGIIDVLTSLIQVLVWPLLVVVGIYYFGPEVRRMVSESEELSVEVPGASARVQRAQMLVAASMGRRGEVLSGAMLGRVSEEVTHTFASAPLQRLSETVVLWVDDDPGNNVYERGALEALGMSVETCRSTERALDRLRTARFDVVISDMGRPGDDRAGYTLLEAIRTLLTEGDLSTAPPFVIYSGSGREEHVEEALQRGAYGSTNRPERLLALVVDAALETASAPDAPVPSDRPSRPRTAGTGR